MVARDLASVLVDGFSPVPSAPEGREEKSFTTSRSPFEARKLSAVRRAACLVFLFIPTLYLRVRGPKTTPPPRNTFARREPWRALPVPFCRYTLSLVYATSARVLVCAVP